MYEDDAFSDVLRANEAYARTHSGVEGGAARKLAVLTCMDSRIDPLAMLGLELGDAKIIRNAGARVTDDVVRTLVLAVHLLGVERVMVVAHTRCRGTAADDAAVRAAIRDAGGPDTGDMPFLSTPGPEITLREDCAALRAHPFLAGVRVGGFVYDVDSGRLRAID